MKHFAILSIISLTSLMFIGVGVGNENPVLSNSEMKPDSASIVVTEKTQEESSIDVKKDSEKPIVWFVHGMVSIRDKFEKEMDVLREIYPNAEEVTLKKWNSPKMNPAQMGVAWSISLENSTKFVPELANEIMALPSEKRQRLILIGHSLGGRILVKTSVILKKNNVHVKKIILAGAAINNDDPDIPATFEVSNETVENIINFNDIMLTVYKVGAEFHSALGTGYLYITDQKQFREIVMSGTVEHYGYRYFQKYKEVLKSGNFTNKYIIVPQDFSNVDFPTAGGTVWWDALDSYKGWILQQNQASGHCRIIDDSGVRRAWGRKNEMTLSFEKVKNQLSVKNKNEKVVSSKDIVVLQDYPNWDRSTGGGPVWWNTLDSYKGWKLQQHKLTGHCRILDDSDVRRAWGEEAKMRQSFDDVKKQLSATPKKNKNDKK